MADSGPEGNARCSFCLKTAPEVRGLIRGAAAAICNECVDLCHGILSYDEKSRTGAGAIQRFHRSIQNVLGKKEAVLIAKLGRPDRIGSGMESGGAAGEAAHRSDRSIIYSSLLPGFTVVFELRKGKVLNIVYIRDKAKS